MLTPVRCWKCQQWLTWAMNESGLVCWIMILLYYVDVILCVFGLQIPLDLNLIEYHWDTLNKRGRGTPTEVMWSSFLNGSELFWQHTWTYSVLGRWFQCYSWSVYIKPSSSAVESSCCLTHTHESQTDVSPLSLEPSLLFCARQISWWWDLVDAF